MANVTERDARSHLHDERDSAAYLKTIREYANPGLLKAALADVETARKQWKLDVS